MKAIVYEKYGSLNNLHLKEVKKPVPAENEVLVKVKCSSVNSWDWDLVRGKPYLARLGGLFSPKHKILGCDISGVVEAVGSGIKRLKPGDEVFGDISGYNWGGFAEYVCADEDVLAIKPDNISFEDAAAIPQAAVLALQGLRNYGKIKSGDKVLINGAGGGVGMYAIQMAKLFGAEVTGVDRADKLHFLKEMGADYVMDYGVEDFTENGEQYDIILDVAANRSMNAYKRSLTSTGVFVVVGGTTNTILKIAFLSKLILLFQKKKMNLLLHKPDRNDLKTIAELQESGKIKTVIHNKFSLSKTADAINMIKEGSIKGKVIITVEPHD